MRAIFLGTPSVAVPSLEALVGAGHDVPLVITQPSRPRGRSRAPQPPPVRLAAERLGLPVAQPTRVKNAAFRELIADQRADVLVVVAYGRILTRPVLDATPHGAINVHFSLLPHYRGAAPVQWALARGERVSGVTTMQIVEALDAGDILLQRETAIEQDEHAPALAERLSVLGAELIVETLEGAAGGRLTPRPQDPAAVTYAPLISADDARTDPALEAHEIAARIRGFDPWPGVWMERDGVRVRLVKARPLDAGSDAGSDEQEEPGHLLDLRRDGIVLTCGGGSRLELLEIQLAGRRVMQARDAVNGRQIRPGERFTCPTA